MTKLIGICGRIGAGKTTFADYLTKKGFVEIAFADTVKKIVELVYGFDYNVLLAKTQRSRQKRGQLIIDGYGARTRMEQVGTMFRKIDPDTWVGVVKRKISKLHTKNIVVTDCRYKNEIDAIRELGGKIIIVYKDDADLTITSFDKKTHPSRWEFLKHITPNDTYIKNDSTLTHLQSLAMNIMGKE
jgi:hypothetical protein